MTDLDMKRPEEASRKNAGRGAVVFWAVASLAALGVLAVWLLASPGEKEKWRNSAADTLDSWTADTPVAGMGGLLRSDPAPLPDTILRPQTEEGTLSGREVSGLVGSPVEVGNRQISLSAMPAEEMIAKITAAPDSTLFSPEPLPPVTEDREIRPGYLTALADWLAGRYRTGAAGGTLLMNVQALNNLCGVTLAADAKGGRQGLLRYAFHPGMIQGLYKLYIDRFMIDLDNAAKKRGFDEAEIRDFHRAIAGKATLVSNSLEGVMAVQNLGDQLERIDAQAQKVIDLNAQLAAAVADLDALRNQKATASQLSATQMRVDGLAARYRRSVGEHEEAQRALAAAIRRNAGACLDEDSLLFMAAWVERRIGNDSGARQTLIACNDILRDLARRCSKPESVTETE